MRPLIAKTFFLLMAAGMLLAACAPQTVRESAPHEEKYAGEAAGVAAMLSLLDTCVGGQYIFGAQGDRITARYVGDRYKLYPDHFTDEQLIYLQTIAARCERQGWRFPQDYAWDCSGLWWYCCNKLGLYQTYTDRTASDTFYEFCTPIEKDDLQPGDLVFLQNELDEIVHMGIVGEDGYIYEAGGGNVGVVKKRTVDNRVYDDIIDGGVITNENWNLFGRPIVFE